MFGKNLRYLRLRDNISQEDLAKELGYKSFTTIQKWESGKNEPNMSILNQLADKWGITLDELVNVDLEAKRYYEIINTTEFKKNSIDTTNKLTVYGKVCAGDGLEAFQDPITEIINPYLNLKGELFALQVEGDSMNNVVPNGMYAIIKRQPTVNNGEIAVVLIDHQVGMLKRFSQHDDVVILRPDSNNPVYQPIPFIGEEINNLKIIGKYIGHVSPMIGD